MFKSIDKNSTKRKMINYLDDCTRAKIIEVIKAINDLPEEKYPYVLNISGSKFDLIYQLSSSRLLTPQILYRAISKANSDKNTKMKIPRTKPQSIKISDEDYYKVQRYGELLDPNDSRADRTDLSILNLDIPIDLLLKRIGNFYKLKDDQSSGVTNLPILFSGPSGAGKTNLIYKIAKEANKKVLATSASSFLDTLVGDTEKNIRSVFNLCEKYDWIIFIDEIEGLIHSRAQASKNWELTQVNEFLIRMEGFNGICIVATNYPQIIDSAFNRRMTIKVEFNFMKDEMKLPYIKKKFQRILLKQDDYGEAIRDLDRLKFITPGDIEAVYRKLILDDEFISLRKVIKELESEISKKKHALASFNKVGLA